MTDNDQHSQTDAATAAEVRIVRSWHEALNAGEVDLLVSLSRPDIEVSGPRGAGHGTELLREWVDHAGIRLEPRRIFHEADTVVVEEQATWRSPNSEPVIGDQIVASVFMVRDNQVARVARYSGIEDALSAASLDESHEIPLDAH